MKGTDVTEDQMAKGLRPEGGGMTGAIYGRVSTPDQSVSLQVSELTAWATRMGWTIGDMRDADEAAERYLIENSND